MSFHTERNMQTFKNILAVGLNNLHALVLYRCIGSGSPQYTQYILNSLHLCLQQRWRVSGWRTYLKNLPLYSCFLCEGCFLKFPAWFFWEEAAKRQRGRKEALIAILAAAGPLLSFINSALHQLFPCPPTPHSSPLHNVSSCDNRVKMARRPCLD